MLIGIKKKNNDMAILQELIRLFQNVQYKFINSFSTFTAIFKQRVLRSEQV
jgi:hypothetical protein